MCMKRSEIKVLLVEDDQNIGKALFEGLTRLGYSARWASTPDDALSQFRITEFHVVILDCLLPKKNGVELALEMRGLSGHDFKIILASGIFKDRAFTQDAIQQTKALAFLAKPFEFDKLKELLEESFGDQIEEDKEPLAELFLNEAPSFKDIKEALAKNSTRHGFELPYIYSLLNQCQFTGQLHIVPAEKELSQVSFLRGQIVDVRLNDSESYFGVLLVEMGFSTHEEVEESLATGGSPIGKILVDASALSPHAVSIVLTEQMAIRLSKSIQDTSIEVSLVEENISMHNVSLSPSQFSVALHDWVSSKISRDWLENFYLQWLESPIKITSNLDRITKVKDHPLLSNCAEVLAKINGKLTLQGLLESCADSEYELLQAIHYGVLEKIFFFLPKSKSASDFRALTQKLNKIATGLDAKNHFEVLGLNQTAKSKEISRAYLELAKAFHPDKIDRQAPAAYKTLNEKVFTRMTLAYEILRDEVKREAYCLELQSGSASEAIEIEAKIESARRLLSLGQFKQAEEMLAPYMKAKYNIGQVRLHYLWAKIKIVGYKTPRPKELVELQNMLGQIPPEDRHSATFFYVKGLLYRLVGDKQKAYNLFRNSVAIDASMSDARREMTILAKEHAGTHTDWVSKKVSKLLGSDKKRRSS